MKKILLISLFATMLIGSVFAANVKSNLKFQPSTFQSVNTKDVKSITYPSDYASVKYGVLLVVNTSTTDIINQKKATGINVSNCNAVGDTFHVAPGDQLLCTLSYTNPTISFASDSDQSTVMAVGTTQVVQQ